MIDLPPIGSTVITALELHNKTRVIPPDTVGQVLGYTQTTIIKVDFGEYGVKFVPIQSLNLLDYPLPDELLGMTLLDLVEDLLTVVGHLKEALNDAQLRAPSRLDTIHPN
jgi:hypothetical protein